MKSKSANWLRSVLALLIAVSCTSVSLRAGEAIQFSNPKTVRPEPGVRNKLAKDKLTTLDKTPSSSPLGPQGADSARPADEGKRPKSKEEKRRDIAKVEDKNWAYVDKGQLQEEEDEKTAFGVRDYDVETSGKEKTTADIWFSTKNNRNNNGRSFGNARAPGASSRGSVPNRPQPARESNDTDGGFKGGKTEGKPADQPSSDRSLQSALGLEPPAGKLNETFGGAPGDQGPRGGVGLRSIETQPGTRAPGLGGGDALGFSRDPAAKPALSGSPLLMDSPKSPSSSPFAPPASSSSGLSGSRFGAPASSDANLAPRGFGGAPQPQQRGSLTPSSSRDAFAPPPRPSSGR